MRRRVGAVMVAAVCLGMAAPAAAKSPPKGKYGCTNEGIYFDEVKITGKNTYKRFGKQGKYKAGAEKINFDDGFVGYKIKFKTGAFKGYEGRWYKADSGTAEIALKNPIDGFEDTYCDQE
jgi:hypothetical protein